LRQGDVGSVTEDQTDLLDQMHRNAIRLLDLINQMLDFSKLEAGKVHLRLSSVNLNEYTEDVVSLFREVSARKGLTLDYETGEKTDIQIFIDCDRYERILTNLIRNAVKFTETGGLTVGLSRRHNVMILTVADTGIGIPESHLSKIFGRFEQVDSTSTRQHEGTGLGLAIVEESVHLMHGNIKVESVPDIGTVFTVEIPTNLTELEPHAFVERRQTDRRNRPSEWGPEDRRSNDRRKRDYSRIPVSELAAVEGQTYSASVEEKRTQEQVRKTSGHRILITEDNDDLRRYITRLLERMGHVVISAANGQEALEILLQVEGIDLVVTDIMMPKMDGYELLQAIRGNEVLRDICVIMITAKAGDDPKLRALGIGADDYLNKPINVRELDARIRNLLTAQELHRAAANAAVLDQRIDELRLSFAQTLSFRDAETATHSREVLEIGSQIAEELGIELDQTLKDSLLLHDIGKIGIPDRILLKKTYLENDERKLMERHAELGKELLEGFSNFRDVSEIIWAHQEHWDGTGYPRKLAGEEIPLIARIVAVADAYHAMTNTRPYRKAMSREEAITELKNNSGTQFDPAVVDAFLQSQNLDE
jgi:putative nucleotidyltransferase with HDIG domain